MGVIKMTVCDFEFDRALWAHTIRTWIESVGVEIIAEMIGADENTIKTWSRGTLKEAYPYPSMTLFLRCCNALDLDPRAFFALKD